MLSSLRINLIINTFTKAAPMIAAFFSIPILIKSMGVDKFGILTLIWIITGQTGFLDLGLSKTLAYFISKSLGSNDSKEIPYYVSSAIAIILLVTLLVSLSSFFLSESIVSAFFNIPSSLYNDTLLSVKIMSFIVPLLVLYALFKSVLAGYKDFPLINSIELPVSITNYILPVLIFGLYGTISSVVISLLIVRMLACTAYLYLINKKVRLSVSFVVINKKFLSNIFSYSGWISLGSIIAPLSTLAERLFLSSILPIRQIAYFNTPSDLSGRLLIFSNSINQVMFSEFSFNNKLNVEKSKKQYNKTLLLIISIFTPIILTVLFTSQWLLSVWINPEFAANSYFILQILLIRILFHSISTTSVQLLQAYGYVKQTFLISSISFIIFFPLFMIVSLNSSIIGAAFMLLLKTLVESIYYFFYVRKKLALIETVQEHSRS